MMKPFYQGKIDTFCALYAVLNALRITNSIRTLKARDIFSDVLMGIAENPLLFRQVLDQATDYVEIVDSMLTHCSRLFPLTIAQPFTEDTIAIERVWETCGQWLERENSAVILRFMRYVRPDTGPSVRHWTTVSSMDEQSMHLYDSSHEADAILHLPRQRLVTQESDVTSCEQIRVQPSTLRLISAKLA